MELQRAAVVLAASGNLTKLAGNGPKDQQWTDQAEWAKYSQAVADAGLATVQAVRARNTKALAAAVDQLVLTCINCHREYRLDVPAIWTERQFPPGANGTGPNRAEGVGRPHHTSPGRDTWRHVILGATPRRVERRSRCTNERQYQTRRYGTLPPGLIACRLVQWSSLVAAGGER